jgi:tetratricopeptide (TPR) repeat protein
MMPRPHPETNENQHHRIAQHIGSPRRGVSWQQLKELIPDLQERIIQEPGLGDDFTPLFLDKLFTYLSESQRVLLDILSIYRKPVPEPAVTAFQVTMKIPDLRKLQDLSLLESMDIDEESLYYVHRLTAQYVFIQMEEKRKTRYHFQAAQYFEGLQTEEVKKHLEDIIEARWHYLRAEEWDRAAEITFTLEDYLTLHGFPRRSMELLQELELDRLNETYKLVTYGQMGTLYKDFGEYDKALDFYNRAYEIAQKNNDLKNSATVLQQVGLIYQEKGDYDEALKQYQKSLKIKEKIRDIRGIALLMGQMGELHFQKNEFAAALEFFIQAFLVFAKIGSPYANQTRINIAKTGEKLPEDQFQGILKKFNLDPGEFFGEQ